MTSEVQRRKLIEVSLPLEDINRESAREKSIRYGHPSTLHLWWARRPLAAARAVLFAQLVDDPSSHPNRFPTDEDQRVERERLHNIIRRLVVWENINDEGLFREAHQEILASTDGHPPAILDPFAGGGTIPLEAQRLGLRAHATDLNPVAVLINKALIEIPPTFAGQPPVFPGAAESRLGSWPRATGLAEDVRRYGAWMRDRALERIGHLYPKATLPDGSEATVIAWIWARTVTCPNPACGVEVPLVRSWELGKKRGKEAYVIPVVASDSKVPSGRRITFSIGHSTRSSPPKSNSTMSGTHGAKCVVCGTVIPASDIHRQLDVPQKPVSRLMALVAVGKRGRVYLPPTSEHEVAAQAAAKFASHIREKDRALQPATRGTFGGNAQGRRYGFFSFADYFTDRQLVALSIFGDLVAEARARVSSDALATGLAEGTSLAKGGVGVHAYADAIATYLAFALSRVTNKSSSLCTWDSSPKMEAVRGLFARQAIPMAWDFAEANPFGGSSGDYLEDLAWVARSLDRVPALANGALVQQADASSCSYRDALLSTDPPYYDNIVYSDLSDYFYVWLRRSLRGVHPDLFSTLLVPKAEELVANPYRHGGKDGASKFFEDGFQHVFERARASASEDFPITVYYAFKQQELETEGIASTGWATMLQGMIGGGWAVTATWPIRSELGNRMIASGTNALASSIVLALRPRHLSAETTSRRGFIAALKAELPKALAEMQQGAIAPVDLAQATIGPGMAVFSRYAEVIESDGSPMTVRTALTLINQALDEVLSEDDGELDADTRFCLKWYGEFGWSRQKFGLADDLARATNTSVEGIARGGVLTSKDGWVTLTRPTGLPDSWNPEKDDRISIWEVTAQLARALTSGGVDAAAPLLAGTRRRGGVDQSAIQGLAYRVYELAQNKDPEVASLFNLLGSEWSTLERAAADLSTQGHQDDLGLDLLL